MLLSAASSLLLVVDVQERLHAAMPKEDPIVRNVSILIRAARELGVPVLASEQYPRGLGPTVPEVAALLTEEERIAKMEFSCRANSGLAAAIEGTGRTQIVITGIEAHVCVLQTALDLIGKDRSIYVVADAVASRNPTSREIALRRMGDAGAIVVTTEMVAFEWLRTAAAPQFKAVSALVR